MKRQVPVTPKAQVLLGLKRERHNVHMRSIAYIFSRASNGSSVDMCVDRRPIAMDSVGVDPHATWRRPNSLLLPAGPSTCVDIVILTYLDPR